MNGSYSKYIQQYGPPRHDVDQFSGSNLPGQNRIYKTVRYAYPYNFFWQGNPLRSGSYVDTHRSGIRPVSREYTQVPYFDEEFVHAYQAPADYYAPINPWYLKYGEIVNQP